MTDKLTTLTANVARLLDGVVALPADADRVQAAVELADGLITEAIVVLPDAVEPLPKELHIAGFTIGYCDDGSVYLEADNRPGEEGVSVRLDHLSTALSGLYVAAQGQSVDLSALDSLAIPDEDMAARVVDREVSFDDGADCEGCKI